MSPHCLAPFREVCALTAQLQSAHKSAHIGASQSTLCLLGSAYVKEPSLHTAELSVVHSPILGSTRQLEDFSNTQQHLDYGAPAD